MKPLELPKGAVFPNVNTNPAGAGRSNNLECGLEEGGRPVRALRFRTDKSENLPAPLHERSRRYGSPGMPS